MGNLDTQQYLRFSQLLATTMCHDIAGPLSGISNGLEFIEESGDDPAMIAQSMDLLKLSSREASSKLQFFRAAYGIVYDENQSVDVEEIRELSENFFKEKPVEIQWNTPNALVCIDHATRQLLFNLILIMQKIIKENGEIHIYLYPANDTYSIEIRGKPKSDVNEKTISMLRDENTLRDVSLENIHPAFIQLLSQSFGRNVSVDHAQTVVTLHA